MSSSGEDFTRQQLRRISPASRYGLLIGPPLALLVYLLLPADDPQLPEAARLTAGVATLMALWWMTEAIPLAATALLPIVLLPLLNIAPLNEAAGPYASKFIFLFLGGFLIALAIERCGLHRRIALRIIALVGTQPPRLIGGFMIATALLSMWISNTATSVMMLPMALGVISLLTGKWQEKLTGANEADAALTRERAQRSIDHFSAALLLSIAYSASIGGIATLVGTPPNAFMAGLLHDQGIDIGFAQWMMLAAPLSLVFLFVSWWLLTHWLFPVRVKEIPGGRELIHAELKALGRMSRGEWTVAAVFLATATMWIARSPLQGWQSLVQFAPWVARVDDAIIAMVAALSLFAIPTDWKAGQTALDWNTAKRMPYEILILFGGGLSLAAAVDNSGLAAWICGYVAGVPVGSTVVIVLLATAVVIYLTELTSNLATASVFLPVLYAAAGSLNAKGGQGVDPLLLVIPAALAASCAFMLPVATPPNAVVYGSGKLRIGQMIRAGFLLNFIAIALIMLTIYLIGPVVFGLKL